MNAVCCSLFPLLLYIQKKKCRTTRQKTKVKARTQLRFDSRWVHLLKMGNTLDKTAQTGNSTAAPQLSSLESGLTGFLLWSNESPDWLIRSFIINPTSDHWPANYFNRGQVYRTKAVKRRERTHCKMEPDLFQIQHLAFKLIHLSIFFNQIIQLHTAPFRLISAKCFSHYRVSLRHRWR